MKLINYGIIFLILAGFAYFVYRFAKKTDKEDLADDSEITIEKTSVDELVDFVSRQLNAYLKQDLSDLNLTKAQRDQKVKDRGRIRTALKDAAYGNKLAKNTIKATIRTLIISDNGTGGGAAVTEANIDSIIPFEDLNDLSAQDKFFILLMHHAKEHGEDGLRVMFEKYGWIRPKDQFAVSNVDDAMVNEAYAQEGIVLSYHDKLDYLVQQIFQSFKGFGVADPLYEMTLDEIDAGVSGIPRDGFKLSNKSVGKYSYSHDSLWIMLGGNNIHLSCLSFGTSRELIRVCHNIYKYNAQKVFSRKAGYVISSMADGSRVVVTRPPFSDKYAFYVRKFDSAPSIAPEEIIRDENKEIPILLSKWFIRGQRNIAITGSQGTGKTTLLKSFCTFIENLNIRTQELAFEMYLSFAYPDKNISSFQETETVSAQEGLNVQKKTNGAVNIVGEVASAEQASHIIQTAMVASLFAMFTHHAKTTRDLVEAIALNLLQLGLYKEKRDAVETSSKVLNIDIHLNNVRGHRYIERISEVIPVREDFYPTEKSGVELTADTILEDTRAFYKRMTDRRMFDVNEMVVCHEGCFILKNMPTETTIAEMRSKFSVEELEQFDNDMKYIQKLSDDALERKGWEITADGAIVSKAEGVA